MYVRNFEQQAENPNKVSYMVEYRRYMYIEQKISIYMSPTYFTAHSPGSRLVDFVPFCACSRYVPIYLPMRLRRGEERRCAIFSCPMPGFNEWMGHLYRQECCTIQRKEVPLPKQKRFVATHTNLWWDHSNQDELETSDVEKWKGCAKDALWLMVKSHVQKGVKPLVEFSIVTPWMSTLECL